MFQHSLPYGDIEGGRRWQRLSTHLGGDMFRLFTVLGLTVILVCCVILEEEAFERGHSFFKSKNWLLFDLHVREGLMVYSAVVSSLYLPEIIALRREALKRRARRKMEKGRTTPQRGFTVIMSHDENGAPRMPKRVAGSLRWVPPPKRMLEADKLLDSPGDAELSKEQPLLLESGHQGGQFTDRPLP